MPIPVENPNGARALQALLAREHAWAERTGLGTDSGGRLLDPRDALCFEPDPSCRERLERHPDRPLGEQDKPGAVCEPGSAWGLACNLLEAVGDDRLDGLLAALRSPGAALRRSWLHPHLDHEAGSPAGAPVLALERGALGPVYVEVRGADLAHAGTAPSASQLPHPAAGWGDLEACRRLAIEVSRPVAAPVELAATLRRLRSLTRLHGRRGFRYVVLRPRFATRFDGLLRRAFDGLRMRIGGEVDLDAIDVPTLIDALAAAAAHPDPAWVADRWCNRAR